MDVRAGHEKNVIANGAHVVGNRNRVRGNGNTVTGNGNLVYGNNNFGKGNDNVIHGNDNQWIGLRNTINGQPVPPPPADLIAEEPVRVEPIVKKIKKEKELPFIECPTESDVHLDVEVPDDAPPDAPACVICRMHLPVCAIVPCLHKCICFTCARALTKEGTKEVGSVKCPLCKEVIEKIKRVFE